MTLQTHPMTADELLHVPDDGWRYELVKGELRKMAPAGGDHGTIAMELSWRLAQYVRTHDLGRAQTAETGFLIATNPDTVRAPDLSFVREERLATVRTPGFWHGAPDLVAEVISPNDSYTEVIEKVQDWLAAGVRLVWILDPRKRQITIYRARDDMQILNDTDTLEGEDVVPGLHIPVRVLFD